MLAGGAASITLISNNADLTKFSIKAIRKDQSYDFSYNMFNKPSNFVISFPVEFPVDRYSVLSTFGINQSSTRVRSRNYMQSLPELINLKAHDFQFESVLFHRNAGLFEWAYTGTASKEMVAIFLSSDDVDFGKEYVTWRIWLPVTFSRWEMADFYESLFSKGGYGFNASINAISLDGIKDHSDFWKLLGTGTVLQELISSGYAIGSKQFTHVQ